MYCTLVDHTDHHRTTLADNVIITAHAYCLAYFTQNTMVHDCIFVYCCLDPFLPSPCTQSKNKHLTKSGFYSSSI